MRIAFGTDEVTPVTQGLVARLRAAGHRVDDVRDGPRVAATRGAGPDHPAEGPVVEWPEVGRSVALTVAAGRADLGIVCCFTGTGVSIAANKVPGIRAALCGDAATAAGARRWNDANVLALGLRLLSPVVAGEVVDAFLATEPDPAEQAAVARVEGQTGSAGGQTGSAGERTE